MSVSLPPLLGPLSDFEEPVSLSELPPDLSPESLPLFLSGLAPEAELLPPWSPFLAAGAFLSVLPPLVAGPVDVRWNGPTEPEPLEPEPVPVVLPLTVVG